MVPAELEDTLPVEHLLALLLLRRIRVLEPAVKRKEEVGKVGAARLAELLRGGLTTSYVTVTVTEVECGRPTFIPSTFSYHGRDTLGSLIRNMVWLNLYVETSVVCDILKKVIGVMRAIKASISGASAILNTNSADGQEFQHEIPCSPLVASAEICVLVDAEESEKAMRRMEVRKRNWKDTMHVTTMRAMWIWRPPPRPSTGNSFRAGAVP